MQRKVICISSPRLIPNANTPNIQAMLGFLGWESTWLVLSVCHRETNAIELEIRTGSHTPTFPTTSLLSSQPHTLPFFPSRKFFLECIISSTKGPIALLNPLLSYELGVPGDSDGKESACNAGDPGSIPGSERYWRRKWQPIPIFSPGKFHGQRSLVSCSPWGHKESDTTEGLTLSLL